MRRWVTSGRIVRHLFRYHSASLLTERLATAGRPMLGWVLRVMSRGACSITDSTGAQRRITLVLLARWSLQLLSETWRKKGFLRDVEREVDALSRASRPAAPVVDSAGHPLYLRTDLSFGVRAGGSVGHIAGVLNEFRALNGTAPILLTTADVPTLRSEVEVHHIPVGDAYWNFGELPALVLNDAAYAEACRVMEHRRLSFVYQRYSLNNFAGLRIARRAGVPFVLEYNGSEIWMARNWGHPLKYESTANRIEMLNLHGADLVVVVSTAMAAELRARGVPPDRVIANPNAVDTDRYSPSVDGRVVAGRYRLEGKTVIGFIGTFGPWHGAPVLAAAFVQLLSGRPDLRGAARLLMIGDGVERAAAERIVVSAGLEREVSFTGLIPQQDGPAHLAACDILASPHVPNPDGTPFFGSPTKLFEYLAMGKAVVASDLDQIGDVLRHGDTGWLVPPNDVGALANALALLVDDAELRSALGGAARRDAVAHHTWRAHVRKTMDALAARGPSPT